MKAEKMIAAQPMDDTFSKDRESPAIISKVFSILSAVCMGVALAPLVSILWFMVPWLVNLQFGNFPLYGVSFPLGFCLGVLLGLFLNQFKNGGNARIIIGIFLNFVLLALAILIYNSMQGFKGWDGISWGIVMAACLSLVISGVGFVFSGLFAYLGHRRAIAKSSIH